MAKLAVSVLAVFAILLIAVDASIIRTTVTTTEIEDDNQQISQRCREQIQRRDLNHCERYIGRQSGRRSYGGVYDDDDNQSSRGGEQQHLQQCCQQIRQIDEQCRCDALQVIAREQQQQARQYQQGRQGQEQLREITRRAESIPNQCRIEPRSCRIQQQAGRWF